MLAFADALLLLTETIEDMQKLVNLVDRFLHLFGVSLQPDKSKLIKVCTTATARWTETERISLLCTDADGTVKPIEIRRAEPSEATRYLAYGCKATGAGKACRQKPYLVWQPGSRHYEKPGERYRRGRPTCSCLPP